MSAKWLFVIAVAVLAGCTTGFDRGSMQTRLQKEDLQVTDSRVCEVLALKPQLTFPCRIAVHLACDGNDWRWTAADKKLLESWAVTLRQEGIASDVILMPSMFTPDHEGKSEDGSENRTRLTSLRGSAARYGADALLVLKGAAQIDNHLNPAALANLTVIGGYVVPGSTCETLFVLQGCLLDVHNGFLYATVESEAEAKMIRPTFTLEARDAITRAKAKALADIGPELLKRMRSLRDAYAPSARQARVQDQVLGS
jgi:hypothetical protein